MVIRANVDMFPYARKYADMFPCAFGTVDMFFSQSGCACPIYDYVEVRLVPSCSREQVIDFYRC